MSSAEKHEQHAKLLKDFSNELSNTFMEIFTPVVEKYEQYIKDVHTLYPELNSDMLESLMLESIDREFTGFQYDIFVALFERLKGADIPLWDSCKPWDCEICATKKCEHRMREEKN